MARTTIKNTNLIKGQRYEWTGACPHSKGVIFQSVSQFGSTSIYRFKDVIGDECIELYSEADVKACIGKAI